MGRPIQFDRDEAIEMAMNAFWRNGYEACSVKALSELLGITRSSFYNAFGDRETLFALALERYCARSPDLALRKPNREKPVTRLLTETFREICVTRAADPDARGCLIVNTVAERGCADQPVGSAMAGLLLGSLNQFEVLLNRAVETGELPSDTDVAAKAGALQTLMLGLNLMCRVTPDEDRLWDAARSTLQGLGLYDPADGD